MVLDQIKNTEPTVLKLNDGTFVSVIRWRDDFYISKSFTKANRAKEEFPAIPLDWGEGYFLDEFLPTIYETKQHDEN